MVVYGIGEYFDGKPESLAIFRSIVDAIEGCGQYDMAVKSQISFSRERNGAEHAANRKG